MLGYLLRNWVPARSGQSSQRQQPTDLPLDDIYRLEAMVARLLADRHYLLEFDMHEVLKLIERLRRTQEDESPTRKKANYDPPDSSYRVREENIEQIRRTLEQLHQLLASRYKTSTRNWVSAAKGELARAQYSIISASNSASYK